MRFLKKLRGTSGCLNVTWVIAKAISSPTPIANGTITAVLPKLWVLAFSSPSTISTSEPVINNAPMMSS